MKQIHFFATGNDLLPILESIELNERLKYVPIGQSLQSMPEEFSRCIEIPNLGYANAESTSNCKSFLVTRKNVPVIMRTSETQLGIRYFVDQLINPDTIVFSPGGIWRGDFVLNGRVATISTSPDAKELMKLFSHEIKHNFKKIKAFFVGPNAEVLLDAGLRFTAAAQSPRDFDLMRD